MSPTIGSILMAIAAVAAIGSIGALAWGTRKGDEGESAVNAGYLATFAVLGALTLAYGVLLVAFLSEDFSFMYVAENHSTDVSNLAWLYKISGTWAGREGSLLLWAWILSMFAAWVAYRRITVTDRLSNVGLAVTNFVQLFFLVALFVETNNPFKISPAEWVGPNGELLLQGVAMNPLLQHWAMILHPPTLFIGYAGLAIPFAFAVAALIVGDGSSLWVKIVDRIAVFSWLFLGIGIGLGAIWAYVVLGWGGYWAWDPVENASLLPWLTGVGLLHSFTVYRKRDSFKNWAVMLAGITFALVLLGTFITRSGVVQSVHAFQQDPVSFWLFLSMIVAAVVVPAIGLFIRRDEFQSAHQFESLTSKEASYYFNNVLMLVAAVLVSYFTLASAFPSWMPLGGQSFGPATYDSMARPVGILYVFIMAVCPILSWKKTDGATFWKRVKWPLAGAAILGAILMYIWATQLWPIGLENTPGAGPLNSVDFWWSILGLLVASLAIAIPVYLFIDGARKRSSAKDEGFFTALFQIFSKARSQSGGYLTHLGIGIILVGLVGSAMFVLDIRETVPPTPGTSFDAAGYTFTFVEVTESTRPNGDVDTISVFDVSKGGSSKGTIEPSILFHSTQGQTTRNVDIIYEPLRDVFIIFEGTNDDGSLSMNLKVNPLISFAWIGFLLTIIGTTIAVWPKKQPAAA